MKQFVGKCPFDMHLGLQKDCLAPVFFVIYCFKIIYPKRVGGRMEDICLNVFTYEARITKIFKR